VVPHDAISELASVCGEIVFLHAPDPFYAVGAHYDDFGQTSDDEVRLLLAEARSFAA
jgi:putative phosphoribosyl transferase